MAALADTNLIVYRFDPRFPAKRRIATDLLASGLPNGSLRIAHQSIVEFVSASTKPQQGREPLLTMSEAIHEAEQLMATSAVIHPTDAVLRTAFRGAAVYRLSWFDAHLWAYAECNGLDEIWSEDFQHGRLYGTVRAVNPFVA